MKKMITALLAALALFSGASCTLDEEPVGQGHITMTLSTADIETKAGNGDVADGGGILVNGNLNPDLVIAIVDKNNNIVAWYPKGNHSGNFTSNCISASATESTIDFTGLTKGTYKVFAVANTAGLSSMGNPALSSQTTLSGLQALYMTAIPAFSNNVPMPLSASGTLVVTGESHNESGQVDLSLKRVVARVSMTFRNLTDKALALHDCTVTLHDISPSRGYLFVPETDDYYSGYDSDLTFGGASTDFTVPIITAENPASVNTYSLSPKLVFPSIAPQQPTGRRYLCDISFKLGDEVEARSFIGLPVHDRRSADILALGRNQDLKIETTISKKGEDNHDITFNFIVSGWDKKEEYVWFH